MFNVLFLSLDKKINVLSKGVSLSDWTIDPLGQNSDSPRSFIGLSFSAGNFMPDASGVARNIKKNNKVYAAWYEGLKTQTITWYVNTAPG